VLWCFASLEGKMMLKCEGSMGKTINYNKGKTSMHPHLIQEKGCKCKGEMTTINLCGSKEGKNV